MVGCNSKGLTTKRREWWLVACLVYTRCELHLSSLRCAWLIVLFLYVTIGQSDCTGVWLSIIHRCVLLAIHFLVSSEISNLIYSH